MFYTVPFVYIWKSNKKTGALVAVESLCSTFIEIYSGAMAAILMLHWLYYIDALLQNSAPHTEAVYVPHIKILLHIYIHIYIAKPLSVLCFVEYVKIFSI